MPLSPASRRIVAVGAFALGLPWSALAQQQSQPQAPLPKPSYRDAWYQQRIAPALEAKFETPAPGPVLYDPNEKGPLYTPIPERRTYTHRAKLGSGSLAMCSGDLAPTRDQRADVADWNDPHWPAEMFRVYFEPDGTAPVSAGPK